MRASEMHLDSNRVAVSLILCSDVEEDGGLVGELLLLNADDGAVHLVVDVGQVSGGGSLTHAAELIINRTVAETDPALVGTEVGHGNAAQMSANGGAAKDGRVAGIGNGSLALLIEEGSGGKRVGEVNFGLGETTHKDHFSVPGGLNDLTWGQF